jgi:hypothetical protein
MTNQQFFSYILRFVPVAVVALVAGRLAKRKREVDSAGNPTLRMWGNYFIGITVGFFFLWMTMKCHADPFWRRYPKNTAVLLFFCVSSFVMGAWCYYYKITLTDKAITRRYLPWLTRVYPIERIEAVESTTTGNAVIRLRDGRRIGITPSFSGRPFFLESLSTLLSRRR